MAAASRIEQQVARRPVVEVGAGDLDDAGAMLAGPLRRAVDRAGIGHHDLDLGLDDLRADGLERADEELATVQHRDRHGHQAAMHGATFSLGVIRTAHV
jgi:hypothetical protein